MNDSRVVGAFTIIENHIHKQLDREQLDSKPVGHTNICFILESKPRHAAHQSLAQPLFRH